jgi:uncharacterized membrane protein (UPF0136 family)
MPETAARMNNAAALPIAPPVAMISLWIYVTLLMAGGLVGLLKAGSKISLVMSAAFAAMLALCAVGVLRPFWIADILLGFLALFFLRRCLKTSKFMPGGMMLLLTLAALGILLAGG